MTCSKSTTPLTHDPTCGMSVDDHLRVFEDLLPQGRAWPRDPDSTLMLFWRSAAEVVKFASDRICELADEFYCETATETIGIWQEQYAIDVVNTSGIDAACIKPGFDAQDGLRSKICAAVASQGGNNVSYFEDALLANDWVVTIEDIGASYEPHMAGCVQAGCTQLGTTPVPTGNGSELGFNSLDNLWDGRAVEHEYPQEWRDGAPVFDSSCGVVPGSPLGITALGSADCCNFAGYWEHPYDTTEVADTTSACATGFDIDYPSRTAPGSIQFPHCDSTGSFQEYVGEAYAIKVVVDIQATLDAQAASSPFIDNWRIAGCTMAGDPCSTNRNLDYDELENLIRRYVPAHVDYALEYA